MRKSQLTVLTAQRCEIAARALSAAASSAGIEPTLNEVAQRLSDAAVQTEEPLWEIDAQAS
jgi:hypothetical protein